MPARGAGTGTLQGTLTATTTNGVATFANLSYNIAETITLSFSSPGLTNTTSSNIVVSATTADRLAFATQPGGVSRAGTLLGTQPVVKTQDRFGNFSSVGLPAHVNAVVALNSGTGLLLGTRKLDIGTAVGNGTATYLNLQCSDAGSKQLIASAFGLSNALSSSFMVGGVERATGGDAISADTVGGNFTTLTGPIFDEAASGDAGVGTIVLNVPNGFMFDPNTPAPSVVIQRLGGSGGNTNNINGVASGTALPVTSWSSNQITFTITNNSSGGVTCALVWTNVRVRPVAGTPLASGNLTKSGTANMVGITAGSTSFGTLTEVPGLATRLAFTTQPGLAMTGSPFGAQPLQFTRHERETSCLTPPLVGGPTASPNHPATCARPSIPPPWDPTAASSKSLPTCSNGCATTFSPPLVPRRVSPNCHFNPYQFVG